VATGAPADETAVRRDLRRQIAQLEAALVRLPPPPEPTEPPQPAGAALLSTADLEAIRDRLLERLDQLDAQRAEVMQRLEALGAEQPAPDELATPAAGRSTPSVAGPAPRRSSPSLAGARIRWVGA
jgi:hypothetical protein